MYVVRRQSAARRCLTIDPDGRHRWAGIGRALRFSNAYAADDYALLVYPSRRYVIEDLDPCTEFNASAPACTTTPGPAAGTPGG